jgi:lysophospholipase L1-like esterase
MQRDPFNRSTLLREYAVHHYTSMFWETGSRWTIFFYLFIFGLLIGSTTHLTANPAREQRMDAKFQAMINQDANSPPEPGGIIFVGSSIFAQWESLPDHIGGLSVSNRAIGGSTTADQTKWIAEVALRHHPAVVVYYCGSNDLKRSVPAQVAYENFAEFGHLLRESLPETHLVGAASIKSPDRRDIWKRVDDFNQLLSAWCAADPKAAFVDINPAFVDSIGEPIMGYFQEDQLHLLPLGYESMGKYLLPVVSKAAQATLRDLSEE